MSKKRRTKSNATDESQPKLTRAVLTTVLGIVIAVGLGAVEKMQAATINVPDDYATIQEAVDAAVPGDTIMVGPGQFKGAKIGYWGWEPPIDKSHIKLIGDSSGNTIINEPYIPWPEYPYYSWGLVALFADGVEISNFTIGGKEDTWRTAIMPNFCRDLKISNNKILGNFSFVIIDGFTAPNIVITNNTIEGNGGEAIRVYDCSNAVVTGNAITGTYIYDGIFAPMCAGAVFASNIISGSYWRGSGIYSQRSPDAVITGNTISGTGQAGIYVNQESYNSIIEKNTIVDFRTTRPWGAPIIVERSSYCVVTENELIDVYDAANYADGYGPIAGIRISGWQSWLNPCDNNILLGNYFRQSGLPGLTAQSDGPFCVILEEGTKNSFVKEQGGYPLGTNAKTQVFDGGYYDEYGNWTTTNRVVGHDADQLAQHEDLNPGIGQRLKVISDISGETEEE